MRWIKPGARGLALTLLTTLGCLMGNPGEASAKSKFVEMTMQPTGESVPGQVSYLVTVRREGQGFLDVVFSPGGMPEGVTVTFSPNELRFSGRVPQTQSTIMTITGSSTLSVLSWPFTLKGTSRNESITLTNQVALRPALPVLMIGPAANGQALIRGENAIPSRAYELQSTPDVANPVWTPFGSTIADGTGRFAFTVQTTELMRFFRAVVLE